MWKFGVRFFDGSCKVFDCKCVNGVRFLCRMYLYERVDVESIVCFVDGEVWKWKYGKWKCCKKVVREEKEYIDLEKLGEWREKSVCDRLRQCRIRF